MLQHFFAALVHFSDANVAQKFMTGVADYKIGQIEYPEGKHLHAVFAKFQGLSAAAAQRARERQRA